DLLDVLCGGLQQALAGDADKASKAGVAVAVQLLGVGEGAFHRFLAPLVDRFSPSCEPVGVSAFAGVLPDMAGDGTNGLGVGRAGCEQRAGPADGRIRYIMLV